MPGIILFNSSVLQCVAACCSVFCRGDLLQHTATHIIWLKDGKKGWVYSIQWRCVAVCCNVLQGVFTVAHCNALQHIGTKMARKSGCILFNGTATTKHKSPRSLQASRQFQKRKNPNSPNSFRSQTSHGVYFYLFSSLFLFLFFSFPFLISHIYMSCIYTHVCTSFACVYIQEKKFSFLSFLFLPFFNLTHISLLYIYTRMHTFCIEPLHI